MSEVGQTVFRALLDAAGPTGSIHVAFRIFPEHIEVDVLHSEAPAVTPGHPKASRPGEGSAAPAAAGDADSGVPRPAQATGRAGPVGPVVLGEPGQPATFAEWMSSALRREGLSQEAAARQLGVSVKTVSRWVGGATEPRMRDLRRIQEVFGELPLV
jgi:Helix-turn-helix